MSGTAFQVSPHSVNNSAVIINDSGGPHDRHDPNRQLQMANDAWYQYARDVGSAAWKEQKIHVEKVRAKWSY